MVLAPRPAGTDVPVVDPASLVHRQIFKYYDEHDNIFIGTIQSFKLLGVGPVFGTSGTPVGEALRWWTCRCCCPEFGSGLNPSTLYVNIGELPYRPVVVVV